jgi:hypothetical protein
MVQYTARWKPGGKLGGELIRRRLNAPSIGSVDELHVNYLHAESDCPKPLKDTPAAQDWKDENEPRYLAILEARPGGWLYQTRNGFHMLYQLPEPFAIETPHDAVRYTAFIGAQITFIKQEFGVQFDDSCKDWQRMQRLPRGTRE